MIKAVSFFLLGLLALVLQSTWFFGEVIHPFRLDLIFILIVFLGTQDKVWPVLLVGFLLGLINDVLSWGGMGKAMFLYPLIIWIMQRIWFRTVIQSLIFLVVAVFIFNLFYALFVYFFQALAGGGWFTRQEALLVFFQAVITMLLALPMFYFFQNVFGRKTALS